MKISEAYKVKVAQVRETTADKAAFDMGYEAGIRQERIYAVSQGKADETALKAFESLKAGFSLGWNAV